MEDIHMKSNRNLLLCILGLTTFIISPSTAEEMKPYEGSPAFEKIKTLIGDWQGTMEMDGKPVSVTATYQLTSGGSAILEIIFRGMPREMATLYHDNSRKELIMTHYCMLHNQPKLKLVRNTEKELFFDLADDSDIDVATEEHMHSLKLKFDGPDKMIQYWTKYEDGKKHSVHEIKYVRVKAI
jgi:hypothetical protein